MQQLFALLIVFLASCLVANGQYFQYTQYNFTQQRINPAQTGTTRFATAATDFRHQRTGGGVAINSNFLALSYPILQSSTGRPWSGIGVAFHNDQSSGIFRTQEAAVSYAIHAQLSKWQTLSLGVKALTQTRRISYDGYYTGSQYVPDRGFDTSFSNGENLAEFRSSLTTFSAGLNWQEIDRRGRLRHHVGLSLFDFNRPTETFLNDPSPLSSTFVFEGGFESYSSKDLHIYPEALVTYSAANISVNTGLRFQKELKPKSKQLSDRVELLTKYAVGRSGIVGVQLHRENFSVGVSYDFPLFRLNPGNTGALEFGVELRRLVSTRAQKAIAKRKKVQEEKQKALAQKTPIQKPVATKPAPVETPKPDTTQVATQPTEEVKPVEVVKMEPEKKLQPSAEAGDIKQDPVIVEKVTLHFPFEFNSADLDEESERFLNDLTAMLNEKEGLKILITGHTDNIGSDKFNLRLSQKRADAVKHHFLKIGIAAERMQSEGKGLREPLNENLTETDRAKNRRVEITLYY